MNLDKIRRQLIEELKFLKDRRGVLQTVFFRLPLIAGFEKRRRAIQEIRQLRAKAGYLKAGKQTYFRLFGRDSLIAAWQLLDWNTGICKATIEILSQFQGKTIDNGKEEEPGKILHETDLEGGKHPGNHFPFPYYGSVDATPLFIIVFAEYLHKTNDKKFFNSHWENILMAVHWIEEYGDKDKDYFLEYERKNPNGLFHQGWKDGFEDHLKIVPPVAIVEVQGYQYLALQEAAELACIKKDWDLENKLKERAANLKKEFNLKFWMEDEKYFALALDGKKRQRKAITSNPGHLLFTGIIDRDKIDPLVRRLFAPDLWTEYGIRTQSTEEPDFDWKSYHLGSIWPHDNWIIAQGLKKLGYKDEYQKIKNAMLKAYEKLGCLPEYYGVSPDGKIEVLPANYPQAWASGALLNFLGKGLVKELLTLPSRFILK